MAQHLPPRVPAQHSEQISSQVSEAAQSQIINGGDDNGYQLEKLEKYKFYDDRTTGPVYDPKQMPFVSANTPPMIGEGARGSVYKAKILPGHFRGLTAYFGEEVEVARKEFRGERAKENFIKENKICQIFPKDDSHHPGIVKPWFSYAIATENDIKYNICFEIAECDLRTYLSDNSNFPNGDARARIENIKRMRYIAAGLKWLGELVNDENGRLRQPKILHLDLHWANILVCGKDRNFKISDFGGAVRREDIEATEGAGCTQNIILSGAFSTPESNPTETSDVWSFGCILLLVLLFNYEGVGGLNEFMASLLRGANVARFFNTSTGQANLETKGCIDHLRRRIAKESDRLVTEGLLNMLEKEVLVPFKKRKRISHVVETIRACLEKQHTVEPQTRLTRIPVNGKFFHHCAHASNGRFEVCHEDTAGYTMRVWIWHDLVAVELPLLEPVSVPRQTSTASEPQRIYTRSSSCTDNYVCQVITNCDPLELLLYKIPETARQPVSREVIRLTNISKISHAALDPNAKYIALDADRTLRFYDRNDLLNKLRMFEELPTDVTIPSEMSQLGVCGDECNLIREKVKKRLPNQVTEALCFSKDGRYLYHAYRSASPMSPNMDCVMNVDMWNTEERRKMVSVPIEKDADVLDFLQCLTPFNKRLGFLFIGCNDRMSMHTGTADDAGPIRIPNEKPCALIISPEDDYAVILGGRTSLNIHVVDLRDGLGKRVKLKLEAPKDYAFKEGDAASIISRDTLLISYHKGTSVTFDLMYALDDLRG